MPDDGAHYVIRGGFEGRERLRVLGRVMQPTTRALLERVGVRGGTACLDVGCGGGDATFEMARMVGPGGRAVGVDIDDAKLALARREAAELQLPVVEFVRSEAAQQDGAPDFDVVYARFLLTHLSDPAATVAQMVRRLRPGGMLVVEDVDFRGHFSHPDCPALGRYVELYSQVVRRRGGDPDIGPRLPALLLAAGCRDVGMNVVQPAGLDGDVKLIAPITMENIADAVLAEGLASRAEIDDVVRALYTFAEDPRTVLSIPRVVQAWGVA